MIDNDELNHARTRLDQAAAELDTPITARLRAARLRAIAVVETRRGTRTTWWMPLSAAAAAGLVAVTVALLWWSAPEPAAMSAAAEDLEWLMVKDSTDLFDDLEFYHWLEDEPDAG